MEFTTTDRDNDIYSGNCADYYDGPFWFSACHAIHPLGDYTGSSTKAVNARLQSSPSNLYPEMRYMSFGFRRKCRGSSG
jgi:hypothetical protein